MDIPKNLPIYTKDPYAENIGKLVVNYRDALIKAFEAGAKLKRAGYNPPKISLRNFTTDAETEFFGVVGLDVNGDYLAGKKR